MNIQWSEFKQGNQPFLIAEIGVNFFDIAKKFDISPMEAAKKMIDEAKGCGCWAVKFQSYKAEKIASIHSPAYWDTSKEKNTSQFQLFSKFDSFDQEDYNSLKVYCDQVGILFLSTPFDFDAADYLDNMMPLYKISSSDLSNHPFIKHICTKKKPIFLSTGASELEEVIETVELIQDHGIEQICVMHCMLSYPTKNKDANINVIDVLREQFPNLVIGYSDHTEPDENMLVLTSAFLKGATIIEKHFTLDKTLPGNDHYHAADPNDFQKFWANMRLIQEVSGQANRTVFECEKESRKQARRSIVAAHDLPKGHVLSISDFEIKRPGTGILPKDLEKLVGMKMKQALEKDEIMQWVHVEQA